MGLVIIALRAEFGGYDALADPVGWLLVLLGVRGLPGGPRPAHGPARGWPPSPASVSVPLWIPGVSDALEDTDPSLLWAVNLPQLGVRRAALPTAWSAGPPTPGTTGAGGLAAVPAVVGFVAVALLPVLVFGAGVDALEVPTYVAARRVLLLALIWPAVRAGRPGRWATRPLEDATRAAPPAGGTALVRLRVRSGQAGITLRATVADTSSCSLTDTSWAPSDLIGLLDRDRALVDRLAGRARRARRRSRRR